MPVVNVFIKLLYPIIQVKLLIHKEKDSYDKILLKRLTYPALVQMKTANTSPLNK